MTTVAIEKAQKDLPDLIQRALKGEEILITSEDQAFVRLLPMGFDEATALQRGYGSWAGKFKVEDRFFEPLSDEECGYDTGQATG
jgi:antitoxin (DNA-binding transcriptional repressor) of toxin-antitoxin stability system